ncbi:uncharacterized protein LOC126176125 [Schistocerca cancellata]|uniref:uncharacterized protein LOC126176125 n=1 Tax=Schistocerca cancellata TaxID=274614 RepID=UPI0021192EEB|nr:uncharacterized protein LOC126176125 [Schistocerca cancellata]
MSVVWWDDPSTAASARSESAVVLAPSAALRCYRCGEYTDGVGSITPCLNYTAQRHLKECPPEANHCVKYVSEASIVRECADKCVEKVESWGTNVYCCAEDACNGAPGAVKKPAAAATGAAVAVLVALLGAGAGRLLI